MLLRSWVSSRVIFVTGFANQHLSYPKQDPKPFPTGRHFRIQFWDSLSKGMVLLGRIELPTSSLPMTRSTTELQQLTPKVRPYAKGLA